MDSGISDSKFIFANFTGLIYSISSNGDTCLSILTLLPILIQNIKYIIILNFILICYLETFMIVLYFQEILFFLYSK